jgi:predicted MPP superfamily phosphohydrolase
MNLQDLLAAIVIPGPLLWAGAFIGHGFFLMTAINWVYSFPIYHRILDALRLSALILVLLSPFVFLEGWRFPHEYHVPGTAEGETSFRSVYLGFFFLMGTIVAPVAQISYWLRRPAPQVTKRASEVFDIARHLGFPPRGSGKEAAASRLPGNQIFQVEFVELHLRLPNIPEAWDGLTLLHLTDLHFHHGLDRKFYTSVFDRCVEWGTPDLLCITGDIVDSDWHHRWIVPLLGRLRWKEAGMYILGNHDTWYDTKRIRRRFHRLGMLNLGNCWKQLTVRGHPLLAVGYEAPWFKPEPNLDACPTAIGEDKLFRLCLSHGPDSIPWARKHKMDLMLAGHVHGGQIRLPLFGSLFVPSRYSRRFDCGTFFEAPTVMHVGRGLSGKHLLRVNCRPEVTKLVLHRG